MVKPNKVALAELLAELDEQVGSNPLPSAPRNQVQAGGSFVLFGVLTSTFGVPVESVMSVLQIPRLCRLPNSPPWLAGVFYASGSVTPLLSAPSIPELLQEGDVSNSSTTMNGDAASPRRCLVIGTGEIQLGLEVDEVFGVYRLELDEGRGRVLESWAGEEVSGSTTRGSRLSDTLHWRVAEQTGVAGAEANAATSSDVEGLTEGGAAVEVGSEVRVLSLSGLLASDELTRFANRSALVRAMNVAWDSSPESTPTEVSP